VPPLIPTGRKDRGGGDTIRGHGTGEEALGPGTSEQLEREEKGGFKAIFPVPVGSNLTREVPTPPLESPWDRYDPGEGHAPGAIHVHGARGR